MRVGIISLIHESNTFLSTPTTIDLFRRDILLFGEEIRRQREGGHHEVSGFFEGLKKNQIEAVPIFYASTFPSGVITRETCEELLSMMFDAVENAGQLDGYLLAVHGANTGEGKYRDLDGHWLTWLREYCGAEVPIIGVIDSHANLSPRMVAATDAIIAYRTNPHLDQKERGLEAAELMARTLRGELKPVQAASFPPVVINIDRQNTSEPHCQRLFAFADELRRAPGVLSNGIVFGFPYADVEEMGSAFITVTDNDRDLAQRQSDALAEYLIRHRQEFAGEYLSVEDAVEQALSTPGPVGLLDMGDNVGGGAAADGTTILYELHRRAAAPAFVTLYDPEAAQQAISAGIGARVLLRMGGKTDDKHGPPFEAEVTVCGICEGKFVEKGLSAGGLSEYNLGPIVTVRTDSQITINLTQRRVVPLSIQHMTCSGLDPKSFQIIVGKGVQSPRAALEPYCTRLIRVNTPGVTSADLSRFDYKYRRRPLFPLEEISDAAPTTVLPEEQS